MNHPMVLRRLLLAPPGLRTSILVFPPRNYTSAIPLPRTYASHHPSVLQKSFWVNMIPKPWRKTSPKNVIKKKAITKEWNPATFFIIIFLLIGSMSIQMIALRNEFTATTRRADAKIGLLKEIIEKIQNGEEVDVEGLLGTGDKQREEEWEEVLKEIEKEDEAWERTRRKPMRSKTMVSTPPLQPESRTKSTESPIAKSSGPVGFY